MLKDLDVNMLEEACDEVGGECEEWQYEIVESVDNSLETGYDNIVVTQGRDEYRKMKKRPKSRRRACKWKAESSDGDARAPLLSENSISTGMHTVESSLNEWSSDGHPKRYESRGHGSQRWAQNPLGAWAL